MTAYEIRRLSASLIFDLEDRFARARGVRGPHPRPIEPIRFFVTAEIIGGVGGIRQDFVRPLELVVQRNPGGYYCFFGTVRMPDGSTRRGALAPGAYAVRAESRFYQRVEREDVVLPTPGSSYFYDLPPGYAYPFPTESTLTGGRGLTLLRGGLYETDGRGVAGATIEVIGLSEPYLTDETGQWVLLFADTQASTNVTVRVTFPDATFEDVLNVPIVQGTETGLAQTALRGRVLSGAGLALPGARVEVQGQPGQVATASDGGWFYYFGVNQGAAPVDVNALLPDGQTLTENNIQVQPRATVVVPTFQFP
ncbi:MAG: carboxypeptidase regulatory-like domain-containing protein [Acidobacteria bacterium]|nr:carboxypeptidase regulatory-like domain-containing protein [Acidobacteriota bacterium]